MLCPSTTSGRLRDRFAHPPAKLAAALLLALSAGLAGCMTAEEWRLDADEETYALIDARRRELFSDQPGFNIEPPEDSLRQRILRGVVPEGMVLELVETLDIAAENSRDYQSRKERFYQVALNLTLERWRFSNQFGGSFSGTVLGDGDGGTDAAVDGDLTLDRLLGTGAQIAAGIGGSLFRLLSTGDGWDAISDLSLSVTQPLLRGAGRDIVEQPLTQAERNLVYETRSFERFRRTFAVDVATRYYGILQTMQNVLIEEANVDNLTIFRRRNEAMAEAGRMTDVDADQTRQNELNSNNRLIVLRQRLQGELDNFKIFLGLPVEAQITLDPDELARLRNRLETGELAVDEMDEDRVVAHALAERLDYLTTVDQVYDSYRTVVVAANDLEADVDLTGSVNSLSEEGRPAGFRSEETVWAASMSVDMPWNRTPERNAYRNSIISWQATRRSAELLGDQIRASLRDQIRTTKAALESYDLQENGVTLAERRVESAALNLEAGRAETRDLLEAQEALRSAQNALTAALVQYVLARLNLYLEMEALTVSQGGISVDNQVLDAERTDQP